MLIAAILALLPLLSFVIQRRLADKKLFERNWTVTRADWVFVPFNALVPFVVLATPTRLAGVLALAVLANIAAHRAWRTEKTHLYRNGRLSAAGQVHFAYSSVQSALILLVLLYSVKIAMLYIALALLAAYALLLLIGSHRIHGRIRLWTDVVVSALILALIALRLAF